MRIERSSFIVAAALLVVGGLVVYPLAMIIHGSFWSSAPGVEGHYTLQGFKEAYSDPRVLSALWTTFWLAAIRTLIATVVAIFFAWLLARTDLPFKGPFEVMIWLYFFLPIMPMTFSWVLLLSPHFGLINQALMKLPFIHSPVFNIFSYPGIIWAHLFIGISIRTLMITPAFKRMDASLEESARMSGAGNLATLFRITVPLLMPAILGATLVGFINALESFDIELVLGRPMGVYVYTTKVFDLIAYRDAYPPAMALTLVFIATIVPLILLYWHTIGQREFTTVSGRGMGVRVTKLGRWRWFAFSLVLLYVVIGTLLPLALLVLGSFMKYFGVFSAEPFTRDNWSRVLTDALFWRGLKNTLLLSTGVGLIGTLLYAIVSYIIVRTRFSGRRALDFITWLPWSVPGLVLALGILWAYVGGLPLPFTLYGTLWLMILALVIKQIPFGMRVMNGTMVQIGKELEECAWVHGGSWLYTFRRVLVPILSPAFLAVAVVLFLVAARDVVTVVLLYAPKSTVLSTIMLDYWMGGTYTKGMIVGLVISVISISVAILARVLGARHEIA